MTRYSAVLEADGEAELLAGIKRLRGMCLKVRVLGMAGFPDRLILLPGGRFYLVELKKDKDGRKAAGKLEPSQEIFFPKVEKLGFTIHILVGLAGVQQFLSTLEQP